MNEPIALIKDGKNFSSYYFYNNFLKSVSQYYREDKNQNTIQFSLIVEEDNEIVGNKYFIDPITLPLLVSLAEQLKKYHRSSLPLLLSNNKATKSVLSFLDKADFFHLVGENYNPTYPIGKEIFSFDKRYLGDLKVNNQRAEHKLRGYSINEEDLSNKIKEFDSSERQRDYLVEYYTYKVKDHFGILLFSNNQTQILTFEFIDILAELITNGVLHSGSDAYTLMFSNKFKTSFSISDSGIGLYASLSNKDTSNNNYYIKFEIFKELKKLNKLKISEQIENSLLAIFETLYYSMLKDRKGLFDLMCNVVINCEGYFRLHNENAQIIISNRMLEELIILFESRKKIIQLHDNLLFKRITKENFEEEIKKNAIEVKTKFIKLAVSIFERYHIDTRFSSIRLFEVKFRGVHVEVEIPNVK
ncbi:hypothetical protein [Flavobacterium sp. CF136]|uniref:hypothetical protein n=1 Tax=Flavobacterium sp. (strain CF136) TaxID=1144313 RepID=UPI00027185D2|nr:hypothetical protein [Flavobacterium sp. CF136]EJL59261.1 hypothetical protein PMI10_04331 [Flavobacterium sp. CF136]